MADDKRKPAARRSGAGTGAKGGGSAGGARGGGTAGASAGGARGTARAGTGAGGKSAGTASRDATDAGAAIGSAAGAALGAMAGAAMTAASAETDLVGRTARHATTSGADIDEQNAAGSGPGAGRLDDTAPATAELGGGTADGDGLTAAALTASSLGDEALDAASEPIVVVESLTVLSETPLQGDEPAGEFAAGDASGPVDPQHRWLMIAERAYLRAADRGFAPGGELDDWLDAEREVDARLASR